jgi:choline dehydrogenase-like flavoprotein
MGVVSLKPGLTPVGWGGLQHLDDGDEIEVGYAFAREYWGRGLATELARGWLAWGFDRLHVDRIVAVADPANTASRHVMGTLRMGTDPKTSVCNPDGRFHAVENLWASDGALFPTSSGFNPTHTIVSLACHVAGSMLFPGAPERAIAQQ